MKPRATAAAALLAALILGLAGCGGGGAADGDLYTCGMHPEVIQEGPGLCPICHMDLTPMHAGHGGDPMAATTAVTPAMSDGEGGLQIDPLVVQNMGVRTAPVIRGSLVRHVRTLGEIEVAEDQISVVNLRYSGWVEAIHVDQTGEQVRKGQALFDIYSPELVGTQEEYLLALRSGDDPLIRSTRRKLELWELSSRQIDALAKAGEAARTVTIHAPRAGYVLHKNVVEGARVTAGSDLYRIGDLATIWVLAEVYEFDAPWIAEGQPATMELSFTPGETYAGHVSYVYPTLSQVSRTLKVRLEFENPGLALRPGMFATVRIEAQRRDGALTIPTEAILHGGDHQTVFVVESLGHYRSQRVTTGLVGDNRQTEVLSGLDEGAEVVVSGQFLLDSESQLQEAVAKMIAARLEAGGQAEAGRADHGHGDGGQDPSTWTCPMHPEVVEHGPGACPICGMDRVEKVR